MWPRTLAATFAFLAFVFTVSTAPRAQISVSFEPLGLGPSGIPSVQSEAWDASADGSIVIGQYWEPAGFGFRRRGFRWTAATGMQDLGSLNPNAIEVHPLSVSADGSKIVGWARGMSGSQRPFLWTATGGMQELVEVPGTDAVAAGISRDGLVIAGYTMIGSPTGPRQAFLWRDGMVTLLGFLPNEFESFAQAVCGAGDVVVGHTRPGGGVAFRWTAAGGMQDLGALTMGGNSEAFHCSDDGAVVVGSTGDRTGLPPPAGIRPGSVAWARWGAIRDRPPMRFPLTAASW